MEFLLVIVLLVLGFGLAYLVLKGERKIAARRAGLPDIERAVAEHDTAALMKIPATYQPLLESRDLYRRRRQIVLAACRRELDADLAPLKKQTAAQSAPTCRPCATEPSQGENPPLRAPGC